MNKILKFVNTIKKSALLKIGFIVTGIVSTAWFLVRVIPKPQRATYPCMRAAAPVMSGFIIWLLSLVGSVAAIKKARLNFLRSKYFYGIILTLIAIAVSVFLINKEPGYAFMKNAPEWTITPNQPFGEGKGIFPGRVVWIHDPAVASWDGTTGNWWDETVVSQVETDNMLKESLVTLTGDKTEKEAWAALFKYFITSFQGITNFLCFF